ncbi:MAG: AGE family epimerase/isomerase [Thiotrichales bacterium]|jgi:mannose/cellobiose epimerase-like protein (N-acyl-D-glucosamine 2-epimerase family)|nr:AGE family epimerase/isomerase [Thiotrichales bacterium]MBT3854734.1 AGE family epimerase/isomerase [Thiotrichales bacterium]MBT4653724.1 AGE family epimerase/isomerase [Thiotrichales bacterium]MBT5500114.1 AGE family epimerase/isomerase [Thiotrichales bacterium]MBT5984644.1 AGE family epimerase/isomerase [Thiotrichales bacterium]
MSSKRSPAFQDKDFLINHASSIMDFYHPKCIDYEVGGFFHHFRDDGSIYDSSTRHLVSSTRFIFNYSMAFIHLKNDKYIDIIRHGIDFLRNTHLIKQTGGYAWILKNSDVKDSTNYCYGLAFVLLAYSTAYKAGILEAKSYIEETFELMEKHFWQNNYELYADEISADWTEVSNYRGQNANMHSCEALIAAFEATDDKKYLDRALIISNNICNRQAEQADGLIWEHYNANWEIDWTFNKDKPDDLFRPWGFQVGHLTEWSKLLLILERYVSEDWLLPRAVELFEDAVEMGWDEKNEGLYYGFAPNGDVSDKDKYFWVQAETIAAAALLAHRTNDKYYWDWYDRIWSFSWEHMIDHKYGAWYRILDSNNNKYDDLKSPAGKVDYHTMGACYEVMNALEL